MTGKMCDVCQRDDVAAELMTWGCSARGYIDVCGACSEIMNDIMDDDMRNEQGSTTIIARVRTARRVRAMYNAGALRRIDVRACVVCSGVASTHDIAQCAFCDAFVHNAGVCAMAHMETHIEHGDACARCYADVRELMCVVPDGNNATANVCARCVYIALQATSIDTGAWQDLVKTARSLIHVDGERRNATLAIMRARKVAVDVVGTCAQLFATQPDAHNYNALYRVMGALQYVSQALDEAREARHA
jgi:hypothetical protein